MRCKHPLLFGFLCVVGAVVVYGQLGESPATTAGGVYRVTPWPSHSGPDERYAAEVEQHLNRMAAEGWRFHSDLVGQYAKMMVFERAGNR